MCGKVWCGYGSVSVCCLWDSWVWVCERECMLCVGLIVVGLWERVCAELGRICYGFVRSECVLCVGQIGVGMGSEFVLYVGQFGVGMGE